MEIRRVLLSAVALLSALVAADPAGAAFTGPLSPYYLNNYSTGRIYVVQGTTVINSFAHAYSGGGGSPYYEGNLAVTNVVTTNGFGSGHGLGTAGQYTLNGTPTGVSHLAQGTPGYSSEFTYDGTSDGQHNYTVQYSSNQGGGTVIQTDANWQNPVALFDVSNVSGEYLGITYDSTNNSLWISGWGSSVISNYALNGTLLSSFSTVHNSNGALAYDSADDTLWLSYGQSSTLEQWSTSGVLLQSGTPTNLPGGNYLAGEFSTLAPVPEPATLAIWGVLGLVGVAYRRHKRA